MSLCNAHSHLYTHVRPQLGDALHVKTSPKLNV